MASNGATAAHPGQEHAGTYLLLRKAMVRDLPVDAAIAATLGPELDEPEADPPSDTIG